MSLTLKNFKRSIPSSILTRGREYYRNGRVIDLSLEGDNKWTAKVQGTQPYTITIILQADGSLATDCHCPYAYGEHCKHVAAVLYAIEDEFPEYFEGARRKPTRKRATRFDRLRAVLQAAPPELLIETLLDLAREDRELLGRLLLHLETGHSAADVRSLVKDALRPLRRNNGFVDFRTASLAGNQLAQIFNRAAQALPARPDEALIIYQVLFEETVGIAATVDDSYGVLADAIPAALDGLLTCAAHLSPGGRASLFAYCLRESTAPRQQGWGFAWDILALAATLVETTTERNELDATLKELEQREKKRSTPGLYERDYFAEHVAEIQLLVTTRLDGPEATRAFIIDHSHLPSFRQHLIEFYIDQGDLSMARALAEEGVAAASNGIPHLGMVLDYRSLIFQIAEQQGDVDAVIEQARELWLGFRNEVYYETLTNVVPPDEWPEFRTRLLRDHRVTIDMAAWAYAREGLWPEVRDIVLTNRRLLQHYQLEIEARYPDETAAAYRRFVDELLKGVSNRSTYHEAAGYLVRMQKLGHGDESRALARNYIEKYPQRRAMIEELKRAL